MVNNEQRALFLENTRHQDGTSKFEQFNQSIDLLRSKNQVWEDRNLQLKDYK